MSCLNEATSSNCVGILILEELQHIRQDMNREMKNLQKTFENAFITQIMSRYNKNFRDCESNTEGANINLQLYGYENDEIDHGIDNGRWPEDSDENPVEKVSEISHRLDKTQRNAVNALNVNAEVVKLDTIFPLAKNNVYEDAASLLSGNLRVKSELNDDLSSFVSVKRRKRKPPRSKSYPVEESWHCMICLRSFETEHGLKFHSRYCSVESEDVGEFLCHENNHKQDTHSTNLNKPKISDQNGLHDNLNSNSTEDKSLDNRSFKIDIEKNQINVRKNKLNRRKVLTQSSKWKKGLRSCQYCNKVCSTSFGFHTHILTHTRPYKCDVCGKGFSDVRLLSNHTTSKDQCDVHRSEKFKQEPQICKLCGKTCKTVRQLEFHVSYHLGEKPFYCPLCSTGFTQLSNMKRHVRVAHDEPSPST